MKNLKLLLDKYRCIVLYKKDVDPAMIEIESEDGLGIEVVVYGSFEKDGLDNAKLTYVALPGFAPDTVNEDVESDFYYDLVKAILEGDYSYGLKKITLWDKLTGGAIYFSATDGNGNSLLTDYRCADQHNLKELLHDSSLKSRPYSKK
jgi:hypothetical protein